MRVLYLAELVGKSGLTAVKALLPRLKEQFRPDVILANADGLTGGFGLGRNHAYTLHKLGVRLITGGDWIFQKKDLHETLDQAKFVLRPANLPSVLPGRGWRIVETGAGRLGVLNLLGQSGFSRLHAEAPWTWWDQQEERLRAETPCWIVDIHASATAEKQLVAAALDGRVSAVLGSHGRIPTADARISPAGTASLTDGGRCGSLLSAGGFDPEAEIRRFSTGIRERSQESRLGLGVDAVALTLDQTGRCEDIQTIRLFCEDQGYAESGDSDLD